MACRSAFSSVSGSLSIAMQFLGGVSKAKERMYRIGISRHCRPQRESWLGGWLSRVQYNNIGVGATRAYR
jgi:ribosome modulation factor